MERYQILKGYQNNHLTIGFGSYGQVKLARDLKTGKIVAIKIYKIAKNQVLMHCRLSHPKIIQLMDIHIDLPKEITYMVLEYAQEGTLYDKIKMSKLTKNEIKKYFRDVCQGLSYLHEQFIMHRDVKPQNILITRNNQAKLCDFGVAALIADRKTLCGTYEYMAPQMVQNKPYDYKIDIWALGILIFEMIAGNAPFRGETTQQVLEQMKTKIYFCDKFNNQDINFVKTVLRVAPAKRPQARDLLKSSYFANIDKLEQISSTTYEDSTTSASYQFLAESLNQKQMIQLQRRVGNNNIKQTYPPFYISKVKYPEKNQKVSSFYGQKTETICKGKESDSPTFLTRSQKFIKPIQSQSCPNTAAQELKQNYEISFKRGSGKSLQQATEFIQNKISQLNKTSQ